MLGGDFFGEIRALVHHHYFLVFDLKSSKWRPINGSKIKVFRRGLQHARMVTAYYFSVLAGMQNLAALCALGECISAVFIYTINHEF